MKRRGTLKVASNKEDHEKAWEKLLVSLSTYMKAINNTTLPKSKINQFNKLKTEIEKFDREIDELLNQ